MVKNMSVRVLGLYFCNGENKDTKRLNVKERIVRHPLFLWFEDVSLYYIRNKQLAATSSYFFEYLFAVCGFHLVLYFYCSTLFIYSFIQNGNNSGSTNISTMPIIICSGRPTFT